MSSALVVGAGFGGIAAALRLRARGYDVTVYERSENLGGRAQVFERDSFRHDAGPTVITAPFLFDELFELFGRKREDYVEFVPLKPWYRFHFHDATEFDYGGTLEDVLSEIKRVEPGDVAGYERMLVHSKRLFDAGFVDLADQPFHNPFRMIRQIPRLIRLQSYRTVWSMVSKYLKNDKLRQAFSVQPLLVGGSPFDTTSIYGLIHYLEREWGVYFAKGGTGAVVAALGKLMSENGIQIKTGTTVSSILVENKTVRGIELEGGERIFSDIVVSNADPMHLYNEMIDKKHQSFALRFKSKNMRLSMGLFVLFFGTNKTYPNVAHHTIILGKDFRGLLKDIFHNKKMSDDFSLYLHRPTATDPSFAPSGCDSFYVLCPVPNLDSNIDWSVQGPKLRAAIIERLQQTLLPELQTTIRSDFYMTPEDFAHDYLSQYGAGFSVAPYFTQSAWFRFHNLAESLKGLYLTGAGTHPGAGLPGVLCSAKVIERIVPDP